MSDEKVARRWLTAFPGSLTRNDSEELAKLRLPAITGNPERLKKLRKRLRSLSWFIKALNESIAGLYGKALLGMTESSYIELVQWTGEQARSEKGGKLAPLAEGQCAAPADTWQVANHPKSWVLQDEDIEGYYYRGIGSAEALLAKAEELGQSWMKVVASEVARKILPERPT